MVYPAQGACIGDTQHWGLVYGIPSTGGLYRVYPAQGACIGYTQHWGLVYGIPSTGGLYRVYPALGACIRYTLHRGSLYCASHGFHKFKENDKRQHGAQMSLNFQN